MSKAMKIARGLSIVVVIVTYAVLVHHVNASGQATALGAALALAPILLLATTLAFSPESRVAGISLILVGAVACWLAWPLIMQHTAWIFWMQDIGLMLMLLVTFGITLQPGRKALCVHFAELINGGALPAEHERYARKVTIAWVIFFALIIIASTLLFFLASLTTWSIFVNFLTLPLIALMFIGEFMVRRRVLTDLPEGNILDAVRAYISNSARAH
ncbi:MAG TPA: hypothetical protein VK974_09690 [Methylophilaceae bacterium]|nr:hypothetical protein [Methylophilaceae bacterium]